MLKSAGQRCSSCWVSPSLSELKVKVQSAKHSSLRTFSSKTRKDPKIFQVGAERNWTKLRNLSGRNKKGLFSALLLSCRFRLRPKLWSDWNSRVVRPMPWMLSSQRRAWTVMDERPILCHFEQLTETLCIVATEPLCSTEPVSYFSLVWPSGHSWILTVYTVVLAWPELSYKQVWMLCQAVAEQSSTLQELSAATQENIWTWRAHGLAIPRKHTPWRRNGRFNVNFRQTGSIRRIPWHAVLFAFLSPGPVDSEEDKWTIVYHHALSNRLT